MARTSSQAMPCTPKPLLNSLCFPVAEPQSPPFPVAEPQSPPFPVAEPQLRPFPWLNLNCVHSRG